MFQRLIVMMAIVGVACVLYNSPALAQSKEELIRLYDEASASRDKAETEGDFSMTQVPGTATGSKGSIFQVWGSFGGHDIPYSKCADRRTAFIEQPGQMSNELFPEVETWAS